MSQNMVFWIRIAFGTAFLFISIEVLILLARAGQAMYKLMSMGQQDRIARELELEALRKVTNELADRTEQMVNDAGVEGKKSRDKIVKTLEQIDTKVDKVVGKLDDTL